MYEEQYRTLIDRDHHFARADTAPYRDTIVALLRSNQAFLSENNRITMYTDGEAKFQALFDAIRDARHHVHLEYFIVNNDDLGKKVISALAEKARQGIEVRLLFDALGSRRGGGSKKAFRTLTDAGGEVGVFFPSIYRVNYRNHRKIAIIDGTHGFIGGFNIGDAYLGKGPLGYWRDTAIQVTGNAVNMLQLRFFLDWNYTTGTSLELDPPYFPPPDAPGTVAMQIVSGGPDTRWNPIKEGYIKLIHSARESVYIQTPYFIPDESVTDALRLAALSGVDVRIMLPSRPDHPFVHWASLSFVTDLFDAGVRVYTFTGGFLHAKTIVVDGRAGSVGSANWDIRSFRLNFEANAFFYDAETAKAMQGHFERDLTHCMELTPEIYARRSRWIRAKESVSRLFSPLA
jgi:cardiolipin synthase